MKAKQFLITKSLAGTCTKTFVRAVRDYAKQCGRPKARICCGISAMSSSRASQGEWESFFPQSDCSSIQWIIVSSDEFNFDPNGDGPARYNIIHFKQTAKGKYQWVKIGEYKHGRLNIKMDDIQFKFNQAKPPESVCSLPCERGQAKKYVEGESCCWHCECTL